MEHELKAIIQQYMARMTQDRLLPWMLRDLCPDDRRASKGIVVIPYESTADTCNAVERFQLFDCDFVSVTCGGYTISATDSEHFDITVAKKRKPRWLPFLYSHLWGTFIIPRCPWLQLVMLYLVIHTRSHRLLVVDLIIFVDVYLPDLAWSSIVSFYNFNVSFNPILCSFCSS